MAEPSLINHRNPFGIEWVPYLDAMPTEWDIFGLGFFWMSLWFDERKFKGNDWMAIKCQLEANCLCAYDVLLSGVRSRTSACTLATITSMRLYVNNVLTGLLSRKINQNNFRYKLRMHQEWVEHNSSSSSSSSNWQFSHSFAWILELQCVVHTQLVQCYLVVASILIHHYRFPVQRSCGFTTLTCGSLAVQLLPIKRTLCRTIWLE